MAHLVVTGGTFPEHFEECLELVSECLIGRDSHCTVVLDIDGVCGQHAAGRPAGTGWLVEDEASVSGTFVNDRRVRVWPLANGDVIKVGNVELTYRDDLDVDDELYDPGDNTLLC